MTPPIRTQWAGRSEGPFPEVAEVLGIDTDLVLSALELGGFVGVIFAVDHETAADPESLQAVSLRRGQDGILRQVGPVHDAPEEVKAALKELLGE